MNESNELHEMKERVSRLEAEQKATRSRWHYEYKSSAALGNWPLVHIVIGRDPETGKRKTAKGIIAIGRIAIGIIAIGQLALGFFPIGQLSLGLFAALGQGAVAQYSVGQLTLGWYFTAGQVGLAKDVAVGQVVRADYAMGQIAFGAHPVGTNRFTESGAEFFRVYSPGLVDSIRNAYFKSHPGPSPERE